MSETLLLFYSFLHDQQCLSNFSPRAHFSMWGPYPSLLLPCTMPVWSPCTPGSWRSAERVEWEEEHDFGDMAAGHCFKLSTFQLTTTVVNADRQWFPTGPLPPTLAEGFLAMIHSLLLVWSSHFLWAHLSSSLQHMASKASVFLLQPSLESLD